MSGARFASTLGDMERHLSAPHPGTTVTDAVAATVRQSEPVSPVPRRLPRGWAILAALCLVLPAVCNTAFHLLTPVTAGSLPSALTQAAAHPGVAVAAAVLQIGIPVLSLGVLALAFRASAGAPRLAVWGGAFLAGGYLLGTLDSVDNLLQAVVPAHADASTALAVVHGYENGLPGHLALLAVAGQAPGLVLLGLALWRSRAVPRVLAGAFLVTLPLQVLTHSGAGNGLPALSWGWYTIVLAGCAVVIVRDAGPRVD